MINLTALFEKKSLPFMSVSFTEYVLWVVRLYAAVEMSMNSVERVGECKLIGSYLGSKIANKRADLELEVEEESHEKGKELLPTGRLAMDRSLLKI